MDEDLEAQPLEALHRSDQRAVRTVDSLTDADWAGDSFLPGWTRAHVVAHLALNAEGFARALVGVQNGEAVPIYDSNAARDADIADLAAHAPGTVRDRFFAATQRIRKEFAGLTEEQWSASVNRLPEGPVWPVTQLLSSRRMEVEIHHADLGLAYTARDWPAEFAAGLLNTVTANHAASGASQPFAVHATDLGRTWAVGAESPVVSGTAGELGWWLVGRGSGEGLACDQGELPTIGSWQRPVGR